MPSYSIREATREDRFAIARIYNKAISESDGYSDRQERILSIDDEIPDKLYKDGGNTTFIAEQNEQPIGWISLNKDKGLLDGLFIRPEYQSIGVGSDLIKVLEQEAKDEGLSRIMIASNPHVADYYIDKGYNKCEETEMKGINTDETVPCVLLMKSFSLLEV